MAIGISVVCINVLVLKFSSTNTLTLCIEMWDANCQCFLYSILLNGLIIFLSVPFIPNLVLVG